MLMGGSKYLVDNQGAYNLTQTPPLLGVMWRLNIDALLYLHINTTVGRIIIMCCIAIQRIFFQNYV